MERRVNKKLEVHQQSFKDSVKEWFTEHGRTVVREDGTDMTGDFMRFVYDFSNLKLDKEDFQKRKRTKNTVPEFERCTARRASGERCTRRKKEGCSFCGTHEKGTPHGVVSEGSGGAKPPKRVEVWVSEVNGINYYVDGDHNVYMPEDIISNVSNPRKIGSWKTDSVGRMTIPCLG
jgi:hypothetical protein